MHKISDSGKPSFVETKILPDNALIMHQHQKKQFREKLSVKQPTLISNLPMSNAAPFVPFNPYAQLNKVNLNDRRETS